MRDTHLYRHKKNELLYVLWSLHGMANKFMGPVYGSKPYRHNVHLKKPVKPEQFTKEYRRNDL